MPLLNGSTMTTAFEFYCQARGIRGDKLLHGIEFVAWAKVGIRRFAQITINEPEECEVSQDTYTRVIWLTSEHKETMYKIVQARQSPFLGKPMLKLRTYCYIAGVFTLLLFHEVGFRWKIMVG